MVLKVDNGHSFTGHTADFDNSTILCEKPPEKWLGVGFTRNILYHDGTPVLDIVSRGETAS